MSEIAKKSQKGPKKLERHFKGVANHRRIQILLLVAKYPEITLEEICDHVSTNMKTTSEHTRRLVQAGLLQKKYAGRAVEHRLTPYGQVFATFIETFSYA